MDDLLQRISDRDEREPLGARPRAGEARAESQRSRICSATSSASCTRSRAPAASSACRGSRRWRMPSENVLGKIRDGELRGDAATRSASSWSRSTASSRCWRPLEATEAEPAGDDADLIERLNALADGEAPRTAPAAAAARPPSLPRRAPSRSRKAPVLAEPVAAPEPTAPEPAPSRAGRRAGAEAAEPRRAQGAEARSGRDARNRRSRRRASASMSTCSRT